MNKKAVTRQNIEHSQGKHEAYHIGCQTCEWLRGLRKNIEESRAFRANAR